MRSWHNNKDIRQSSKRTTEEAPVGVIPSPMSASSFDTDPSTDVDAHNNSSGTRSSQSQQSWLSSTTSFNPSSWAMQAFSSMAQSPLDEEDENDDEDESFPRPPMAQSTSGGSSNSRYLSSSNTIDDISSPSPKSPSSLEGTLSFRKSRSASGSSAWKKVYVVLNLTDEGSLTCFREKPQVDENNNNHDNTVDSHLLPRRKSLLRKRRSGALGDTRPRLPGSSLLDHVSEMVHIHHHRERHNEEEDANTTKKTPIRFHIGENVCWVAKDVPSSGVEFMLEIPGDGLLGVVTSIVEDTMSFDSDSSGICNSNKPHRLYFKCARHVEKILWLQALERIDRLSHDVHKKRGMQTLFSSNIKVKHRRTRTRTSAMLARVGTELLTDPVGSLHEDDPRLNKALHRTDKKGEKEYLVYPMYAYPNRWMTERELHLEMLKPSETFHDLRVTATKNKKEIGVLKVEALECVGLPVLDLASETDAVVYFVCGSYAFSTDVIWNRLNPKWLPKSRRACILPIYHAYARLFAGVFDDDGKNEKDDFAGRAVIDLSRLRPRSTYDVTLPLRMSAQTYSRKPRGSLRLRISLEWHSDREALMSYIPRTIRSPSKRRPDDDVTVLCANEKAFRNIALTVHGVHMPGKFTPLQLRASMRELNFARKVAMNTIRDFIFELLMWRNPILSGLVFLAWMHCVYNGTPSLVPCYVTMFAVLIMMRTYAMYGSDGPIQQGFIPPSFEELFAALLSRKGANTIEPIRTRQRKDVMTTRWVTPDSNTVPLDSFTHRQQGKWLLQLLGFKSEGGSNADQGYYDMEFPYSQALRDPITGSLSYRRLSVKDSLVVKSKGSALPEKEDSESALDDLFVSSLDDAGGSEIKRRRSFDDFLFANAQKRKSTPPMSSARKAAIFRSKKLLLRTDSEVKFEDLPPRLRYPDQDMDSKGPAKKKKLTDDLDELRDNVHKLSFHLFNDQTHVLPEDGALYFGANKRSGKSIGVEAELERLLNVGPYSSSNPVVTRIGMYMEPILDSIQSILAASRVAYNILTWRDTMLSFWVTITFIVSSVVLLFFPWRLFLFAVGFGTLGPQNWVFRVLEEKKMAPKWMSQLISSLKPFNQVYSLNKMKRNDTPAEAKGNTRIMYQPIISGHTSDNTAPSQLSHDNVNLRAMHQVCVPYSQLNGTQRFYDWPPDPQYAKCTSNVHTIQESLDISRARKDRWIYRRPRGVSSKPLTKQK